MYQFLKADEFIGKEAIYFVEKGLHVANNICTIGKVVYTNDKIVLKPISLHKEIIIKILVDSIPENGSYIQVYGSLYFLKDLNNVQWFDFDNDHETVEDLFVIVNVACWTDLENEVQARKLEEILYKINR